MKTEAPLVSIVTIVFNGERDIEATILSVLSQTFTDREYLVVDGLSADGTMAVVASFADRIDQVISEKDKGIYDAFNKGLRLARGRWVIFLNAGDRFADSAVLQDIFGAGEVPDVGVLYGDIQYEDGSRFRSTLSRTLLVRNTIHHQGAFYRTEAHRRFPFDDKYRVLGDYDINLKLYLAGVPMARVDRLISQCSLGGVSVVLKGGKYLEECQLKRKLLPRFWHWPIVYLPILKYGVKKFIQILSGLPVVRFLWQGGGKSK